MHFKQIKRRLEEVTKLELVKSVTFVKKNLSII